MTTTPPRRSRFGQVPAPQRISGPGELLQAVPYLLGFHPRASLVLVGLAGGRLVVTARLDLVDTLADMVVVDTVDALARGGSTEIIAAVYDDDAGPARAGSTRSGPAWSGLAAEVASAIEDAGCDCVDVLLVAGGRWWSYTCDEPGCCSPSGRALPESPSAFAAAATYAGVVALPDRAALAGLLAPDDERETLGPLLGATVAATAAVPPDEAARQARSVKRAVFATARACAEPGWAGPPDGEVARFAVALRETPLRDAVWMAIEGRRVDGRALWRDLARRLPEPFDAAPLFLFGWASWRAGDGALAGMAAERAVVSDPGYSAADLLLAALSRGVDPRQMPRLRLPRSA